MSRRPELGPRPPSRPSGRHVPSWQVDVTPEPAPFSIPPPPPPPTPVTDAPRVLHAGQLTGGWTTVVTVTWSIATAAFVAVWVSSRTTGLSTWWLGPETEPVPLLASLLVFVAPLCMCVAALGRRPWLPYWGIAASLVLGFVGWRDLDRVRGYAAAELLVALGCLLVSLASFAGMLRAPRSR